MQPKTGIFFDLHGTLLISDNIDGAWSKWAKAFHKELINKGVEISFPDFETYLHGMFEADDPVYNEPGFSLFMRRVKQLGFDLGLDIPSNEVRPLVDKIIRTWHNDMYLDPEAKPMLAKLKESYPVGLITNWEHAPRIYELVEELGVNSLFDVVTVSDEVGYAKPDPRIFAVALEAVGVSAEGSYYVGDVDLDVEGSLNAGLQPVLIKRKESNGEWYQYSNERECNYNPEDVIIIHSLTELPRVIGC